MAAHLAGDVLLHDFLVFLLDVLQRRLNLARLAGVLAHKRTRIHTNEEGHVSPREERLGLG